MGLKHKQTNEFHWLRWPSVETTASGHYYSTMSSLLSSNVVRIIVYGSLKSVLRRNLSTESKTAICYRKAKRMSEKYKISKRSVMMTKPLCKIINLLFLAFLYHILCKPEINIAWFEALLVYINSYIKIH